MYSNPTEGGFAISTIDLATGNLVHNTLILPYNDNDNLYSLKYDNVQEKLFSIHWDSYITSIESLNLYNTTTIYPNPFSQNAVLEFQNLKKEKHCLLIYNSLGQLIFSTENVTNDKIIIERGSLTDGLYYFKLQTNEQTVSTGKFIID